MSERDRTWLRYPWHLIVPIGIYLVLSLCGITQSSIGSDTLREDVKHPTGLMIGQPREVRSDEFLTSTPLAVGVTATGNTDYLNPLAAPQGFLTGLPSGPVSSVVLLDGTVLRLGPWLPDQMLVAARWWLPFLLLVLSAPAFFESLTGRRSVGYFAAALVVLSPASAWWSFAPVSVLAFVIAGAAALQKAVRAATDNRRAATVGWVVLSAVLVARSTMTYQPWVIVLGPAVLLTAVVGCIGSTALRKRALVTIGVTGSLTLALLVGVLFENRAALEAVLNTVYPGKRVAEGGPSPFQEIFGATDLGSLAEATVVNGTNSSEISSAFTVCFVVALLLLVRGMTYHNAGHRVAVAVLAVVSTFWFCWSAVNVSSFGGRLPIVNMVPFGRAADIVGVLAILLLCLVLPGARSRNSVGFSLVVTTASTAVAGYAGWLVRTRNLPQLSIFDICVSSALLAVALFTVSLRPRAWFGYVLASSLALLLVWNVNPVLFGLADLRGSQLATQFKKAGLEARADGAVWVTDAGPVDTLLMANGVPSLSGRQVAGPDKKAWKTLAPDADEKAWNRGGAYIYFQWSDSRRLVLSNPSPDAIVVVGSPCTVAAREPRLSTVIASHELNLPCLKPQGTFTWGAAPRWRYAVAR